MVLQSSVTSSLEKISSGENTYISVPKGLVPSNLGTLLAMGNTHSLLRPLLGPLLDC